MAFRCVEQSGRSCSSNDTCLSEASALQPSQLGSGFPSSCRLCFTPLILSWLHSRCETLLRSIFLASHQAVTLAMHAGCLEAWKCSPPSNVVFLRLAFSCFPGGQVAKLFQDSSLGNAVNIVVTRLILLMEDQVKKKKSTKLSLLLFLNTELQELPDCVSFVAPWLFTLRIPADPYCGIRPWQQGEI